jgi:hypothetical protein
VSSTHPSQHSRYATSRAEHDAADSQIRAMRANSARLVKSVYAGLALLTAALAAITGVVAEPLGLSQDNRDTIAAGFLAAALLDTCGLFLWDRLFRARTQL